MATKTISLELDAYERLKAAKRGHRESFSSVVRRAKWDDLEYRCSELLQFMEERRREGSLLGERTLARLQDNQKRPRRSRSRWLKE